MLRFPRLDLVTWLGTRPPPHPHRCCFCSCFEDEAGRHLACCCRCGRHLTYEQAHGDHGGR